LVFDPLGCPLEPGPAEVSLNISPLERDETFRNPSLADRISGAPDPDRLREICHDLRQPVATIIALAEAALSNDGIPLGVRRRLDQVMNQAEWLGEMLQHLIEPAAAGAAEGEFPDLLRLACDVVQSEMVTYPGDLALQWDGGNMCVAGNGVELRRAITNLLSNAIRAAGPEGKVAVRVRGAAGRVLLTVDDSGPGFGLIQRDVGLGLLAVAHGLASYGGSLEFGRSQMGGVRAVLALRAADTLM
jgi:signal transduction histidine kinase